MTQNQIILKHLQKKGIYQHLKVMTFTELQDFLQGFQNCVKWVIILQVYHKKALTDMAKRLDFVAIP